MISVAFLRRAAPALGFGFALTFCSSVGQTFFISLFAGEMRAAFALSHGEFGTLYTGATLASALTLLAAGKLADRTALPLLAAVSVAGLAAAALTTAVASGAAVLGIGLFGLRLCGQGMLGHIAMTAMGRWFQGERGRAIGVVTLGYPLGEALLPATVAALLVTAGWRTVWVGVAGVLLLVALPGVASLGRRGARVDAGRLSTSPAQGPASARGEGHGQRDYTRAEVLTDLRFYALLPGILAPPFIVTGVLFQQVHLVEVKGWSLPAFAACYPLYATSSALSGLAAGRAVDRFGARRLLSGFLLPLAAALVTLATGSALWTAALFMFLTGATSGATTVVLGALWPELYGTAHLGAIRALGVTLMVFSTSIAPIVTGRLIDAGVAVPEQAGAVAAYLVVCSAYFFLIRRWLSAR